MVAPRALNRAGMICFNRAGEVLVVSALGQPNVWVFPKGYIEVGEEHWETAEREVEEEARIRAIIDTGDSIGTTSYKTESGEEVITGWWTGFAVREQIEPLSGDEVGWGFRSVKFVSWQVALELLSFPDHRNMLRRALCVPAVDESKVTVTDLKEVS